MQVSKLKLFMVLSGANLNGSLVKQRDYFFGIASTLKNLVPKLKALLYELWNTIRVDRRQEVNVVDRYTVTIALKDKILLSGKRIPLVTLGGYWSFDPNKRIVLC